MSNQHYEHMPNKQRAPQQQHGQQFFCDSCKVQLNSLTQAEQHKRGKSHRLKEQNKQSQPKQKRIEFKVARLDFLGLIPPKFENLLRRHE